MCRNEIARVESCQAQRNLRASHFLCVLISSDAHTAHQLLLLRTCTLTQISTQLPTSSRDILITPRVLLVRTL